MKKNGFWEFWVGLKAYILLGKISKWVIKIFNLQNLQHLDFYFDLTFIGLYKLLTIMIFLKQTKQNKKCKNKAPPYAAMCAIYIYLYSIGKLSYVCHFIRIIMTIM